MNNDITVGQPVTDTNNPQAVSSPIGASDSKDFQQAAGLEALQQHTDTLQVIDQGEPIQNVKAQSTPFSYYLMMAVLLAITASVIVKLARWVNAAPPSPKKAQPTTPVTTESVSEKKADSVEKPKKSKSKKRKRGKK